MFGGIVYVVYIYILNNEQMKNYTVHYNGNTMIVYAFDTIEAKLKAMKKGVSYDDINKVTLN